MPSNDTKHVQTELAADEYEQFRALAREQGLSLKEAGHDALVAWIDRQQQADPNDPAFTVLDDLDTMRADAHRVRGGCERTTSVTVHRLDARS